MTLSHIESDGQSTYLLQILALVRAPAMLEKLNGSKGSAAMLTLQRLAGVTPKGYLMITRGTKHAKIVPPWL